MGKRRAFDRCTALDRALDVFWELGYARASMQDLLVAMALGPQSLYDAFDSKKQLYLEVLERYNDACQRRLHITLRDATSPTEAIATVLHAIATQPDQLRLRGCMAVNAAVEFGGCDPDVAARLLAARTIRRTILMHALGRAREAGTIPATTDITSLARHLCASINSLYLAARAGVSRPELLEMVAMAMSWSASGQMSASLR